MLLVRASRCDASRPSENAKNFLGSLIYFRARLAMNERMSEGTNERPLVVLLAIDRKKNNRHTPSSSCATVFACFARLKLSLARLAPALGERRDTCQAGMYHVPVVADIDRSEERTQKRKFFGAQIKPAPPFSSCASLPLSLVCSTPPVLLMQFAARAFSFGRSRFRAAVNTGSGGEAAQQWLGVARQGRQK